MTRAKSLKMLSLLNQAVKVNLHQQQKNDLAQPAMQAMMEFRRDAVLAEADFKTAFVAEAVSFPLGEQPALMSDLALDASTATPMLIFQLTIGRNVNLSVDHDLGLAISNLLSEVLSKTDWGIDAAQGSAIAGASGAVMVH